MILRIILEDQELASSVNVVQHQVVLDLTKPLDIRSDAINRVCIDRFVARIQTLRIQIYVHGVEVGARPLCLSVL
jgi:hypothetical protein